MNKHSYNPNHSADLTKKDFYLSLDCKDAVPVLILARLPGF